jgi:flagellar hook-length control protein FliK
MSQISSVTFFPARPPAIGADPDAPRADDAAAAGDGFAALLAALLPPPMGAAPIVSPATPALPAGAASPETPPADATAEAAGADRLPEGVGGHEQPLGGERSSVPGAAADAVRDGVESTGDADALVAASPRGAPNPVGSPLAAPSGTAFRRPPAEGTPAPAMASEARMAALAGERTPSTPGQAPAPASAAVPAAAVEGRYAERRAVGGRTAERVGREVATGRGEAAGRQAIAASPRPAAPVEQPLAASPVPTLGRLGLARLTWQVDAADRSDFPSTSGLLSADGVAERAAAMTIEPAAGGTARPVQQLALAIDRMITGELRQLTIQLSPRDLGTIEIALELDADRRLTVAILAERPETLDLLRQDARQLERLLGQQGLSLADAGLEFGLMSEQRRDGRERSMVETLDLARPDEAAGDADPGQAPPALPLAAAPHRLNLSI